MPDVDPAERVVNLIIALQHAPVRMTRQQIRETVYGYHAPEAGASTKDAKKRDQAFERMFERDKDMLRTMGIPLETVTDATHGDDIGYRIRLDAALLPPLELTAAETAIVQVAGQMWRDANVSSAARQALIKLTASSPTSAVDDIPVGGTVGGANENWLVLLDAVAARQEVSFEYSSARSGRSTRRLQPWRLSLRGNATYVAGWDLDHDEVRTFRLSRIQGGVETVGESGSYTVPQDFAESTEDRAAAGIARVAVRPESGHHFRRHGDVVGHDAGWDLIDVPYLHGDHIRDAVLSLAGAARVVEPATIATAVVEAALGAWEASRG